jgi:hypothetical protein
MLGLALMGLIGVVYWQLDGRIAEVTADVKALNKIVLEMKVNVSLLAENTSDLKAGIAAKPNREELMAVEKELSVVKADLSAARARIEDVAHQYRDRRVNP